MPCPEASLALSSATVYILLADFTAVQDRPKIFTVTNLNEIVAPGSAVNANVEVLVDPIHPAARVAAGTVPGTGVDGFPILPGQSQPFVMVQGRIQRVWARSSSATIGYGETGQ